MPLYLVGKTCLFCQEKRRPKVISSNFNIVMHYLKAIENAVKALMNKALQVIQVEFSPDRVRPHG